MSYKYRPLCPEFDPPRRFRSKSNIPRKFCTTPDRLFVLCESVLRRTIIQPRRSEEQSIKEFWTVIEHLMPPIYRMQLRHHLNDSQSRKLDYLNHWGRLTLKLGQLQFPKIIIGNIRRPRPHSDPQLPRRQGTTIDLNYAQMARPLNARIQCSVNDFRFCEIKIRK